MARLIDADRLYDQVEAQYRWSSGEEHGTERLLLDAICDSPTIDAIPVEWLQDKVIENGGQAEPHFAFMYVLHEWQKEQEAR